MRWRYNDPPLVWLFVAAYGVHVLEEYAGGFPEWMAAVLGRPLPRPAFIAINAVAFVVLCAAARLSTTSKSRGWLAVAIATIVFANGILHLLGSLATASYSPGLLTGMVLYLPLGQLALLRAREQAPAALFWRGILTGLVAHGLVIALAFAASR
jgi:hypothetical protein